jgi:hypothetical protein
MRSLLVLLGGQADRYQYINILWRLVHRSLEPSADLCTTYAKKYFIDLIVLLKYQESEVQHCRIKTPPLDIFLKQFSPLKILK